MRAFALAVLVLAGCHSTEPAKATASKVLATVNGQPISEDDVAQQLLSASHQKVVPDRSAVLEAVVDQELAAQQARKLGLKPDPSSNDEIAALEAKLAQAKRRALATAWYAHEGGGGAVSDAQAREWFDAHRSELSREVRLTMVLSRSREQIDQVLLASKSGVGLEQLGGRDDLGWLSWAQLPEPWRAPLLAMKAGETSAVISGEHGRYWVLRLDETRAAPEPSFEQALPQVRRVMMAARELESRQQQHDALRKSASIVYADGAPRETAGRR